MTDIDGLVWQKNITRRAPGERLIKLLQDHDCVLRMAVRKVNPEVGPILIPTQAPLYQAPDPQHIFGEETR